MAILDENFSALATEVTAMIDALMELPPHDAPPDKNTASGTEAVMRGFREQIGRAAEAAENAGLVGLRETCLLCKEALAAFSDSGNHISLTTRDLLQEWPTLVMGYLETPADPDKGASLVEFLQDPSWTLPLPAEDAQVLRSLLRLKTAEQDGDHSLHDSDELEDIHTLEDSIPPPATTEETPDQSALGPLQEETGKLVDILMDTFSDDTFSDENFSDSDPVQLATTKKGLHAYAQQLEHLGMAAGATGFMALQEVCMRFQEGLETVASRDAMPTENERNLLEMWPVLVMDYLETPSSVEAAAMLIEQLQMPDWVAPLPAAEADLLRDLFALQPVTECTESSSVADTAPCMAPDTIPGAADHASLESSPPVETEPESTLPRAQPDETEFPGFHGLAGQTPATAAEFEANSCDLDQDAAPSLDTGAPNLSDSPQTSISGPDISDTDLDPVDALLPDPEHDNGSDEDCPTPDPDAVTSQCKVPSPTLDQASEELVSILRLEVDQLAEALEQCLAIATSAEAEPGARRQALEDHAEELERLGDAAESVGFSGLSRVSEHIRRNLDLLKQQASLSGSPGLSMLASWPGQVLRYLETIFDHDACQRLSDYLRDPRWPDPIPPDKAPALATLLATPNLEIGEEQAESRQRYARIEDVSLDLPDDVNAELLDSLLQELPNQTADFSAVIQRLTDGTGALDDVESAKRVAHTLKGAANTVGVRGIANITHHVEDILIACTKHGRLPTQALDQTLTCAADCLETMSETLLGISAPPPVAESLGVLQAVLDWANQIDHQGLPVDGARPAPRKTLPALGPQESPSGAERPQPATSAKPATPAASNQEDKNAATLRVPADLVDELLRLVGETMILNGQLHDRLSKTIAQHQSTCQQNLLLQRLTFELEQLVDIQDVTSSLAQSPVNPGFDPLEMDQYNELHTVTRRLVETATDAREMNQEIEASLVEFDDQLVAQERLHREIEGSVLRTRMVPVKTIVPRLHRSVRQACRLTDKEAQLFVIGEETLADSNILNDIIDPLMHILRNAVDHGIERPEEREILGKNRQGAIGLEFAREGNNIAVRCRDDGAGLNLADIRYTAKERGLIRPDQKLTDDEIARLVLLPGFSTLAEATQVSGRGIGMDAVNSRVLTMKGSLNLSSQQNKGCVVELKLPVTLASTHGLLVRAGNQTFAVSNRGLEQILYAGIGELQHLGSQAMYRIEDDVYGVTTLENLLGLPSPHHASFDTQRPALLVQGESGTHCVILVEEIVDSRNLVVKNLGQYIPRIRGIVGATVLGDGSIISVLDIPELLGMPVSAQHRPTQAPVANQNTHTNHNPLALIVDDSLSARRSLAQFMADVGYEVLTAGDGLDALTVIKERNPDILLVDMEMPRMNGLELTSYVRANDVTCNLPIIMITSRSTEKHRAQANAAGVNAYLTKPFSEDDLLQHIRQQLHAVRGAA